MTAVPPGYQYRTIFCASPRYPERLKGTGEVVFDSIRGTLDAAEKKVFFERFSRDTGIKVVACC